MSAAIEVREPTAKFHSQPVVVRDVIQRSLHRLLAPCDVSVGACGGARIVIPRAREISREVSG